jgi:Domain of unknown function (DUF4440)
MTLISHRDLLPPRPEKHTMLRLPVRQKTMLLLLTGALVLSSQSARSQSTPAVAPTAEQQEMLTLSRTKWRWMSEKKVDSLAALFHGEAMFVHMGGSMTRAQELDVIRSGGIHYKHTEIFEASARVIGTTGIVYNRIRLDAVVGGNEVTNPFVVTEVYIRERGRWMLTSLAFTRLLQ